MLLRTSLFSFFLLCLATFGIGGYLFSSLSAWKTGIKSVSLPSPPSELQPIEQQRKGVTKDIFVMQKGERLHHRIENRASTLTIFSKGNKIKLVEHMEEIKGYLQEKIEHTPSSISQNIRFIEAEKGTYDYRAHHFHTEKAHFALFTLPGKDLPLILDTEASYATGIAKDVLLTITTPSPKLSAKKIHAEITANPKGT